jgi:hypothetical protein
MILSMLLTPWKLSLIILSFTATAAADVRTAAN